MEALLIESADLPWLTAGRTKLLQGGHKHHCLLITGPPAIGKDLLALDMANHLLCENSAEGGACGSCQACHLVSSSMHPDLHILMPETYAEHDDATLLNHAQRYLDTGQSSQKRKPSGQISVDSARLLAEALLGTSRIGGPKVALVLAADTLNRNAANAMLKVLEEPVGMTHFILVTSYPYRLPSTIHSRCVRVECQGPSREDTAAWLSARHAVGNKQLSALLMSGLGPIDLDETLQNEDLKPINALIAYCMGDDDEIPQGLGLAARCANIGLERALTILQSMALATVRESVKGQPPAAGRGLFRDVRFSLHAFHKLGLARERVGSAVDGQLALEDICVWMCGAHSQP